MEKIAIVSSGGFAREVLTLINAINAKEQRFEIVGFIDDDKGRIVHGLPIIGSDEEVNNTQEPLSVVIAVGEPRLKEKIRLKYTNPLISFPTLIHPAAIIAAPDNIEIGQGCIICASTIMTTDIKIHDFVTLNLQCTVGHDTIINDYSAFMPSVNISGEVIIGKGVYVGTGAKIINQVEIGENTIVGAGAVVAKSLPANCTAVGVPAKPIKFH
ncbi:MAG: acetyltransferase [Bacteroidaceae bacterium]|nr:acetyltransferase [Bacteroidaceae bacterium]